MRVQQFEGFQLENLLDIEATLTIFPRSPKYHVRDSMYHVRDFKNATSNVAAICKEIFYSFTLNISDLHEMICTYLACQS